MGIRKTQFINGEFYHIYNRGVDGRKIFLNQADFERFFQGMKEFNTINPIGSLYMNYFKIKRENLQLAQPQFQEDKLVEFIGYCLNENHYHFILQQVSDRGIEKLMQRLGTGYSNHFNIANNRKGSLFGGRFGAIHISSNEYLLHLSAYINLNNRVHKINNPSLYSSWDEYMGISNKNFCKKEIILNQFNNVNQYKRFAESSLEDILKRKDQLKELEWYNF